MYVCFRLQNNSILGCNMILFARWTKLIIRVETVEVCWWIGCEINVTVLYKHSCPTFTFLPTSCFSFVFQNYILELRYLISGIFFLSAVYVIGKFFNQINKRKTLIFFVYNLFSFGQSKLYYALNLLLTATLILKKISRVIKIPDHS